MTNADPLAQLHDIIIPLPISTLPIAIGWWLLLTLIIALLSFSLFYFGKKYQQGQGKRCALALLTHITTNYEKKGNAKQLINQLSQLLRRTALHHYPQQSIAGLTDKAWLDFLNRHSETPFEKTFITAPYQAQITLSPDDCQNLIARTRRWIQTTPNPR